MCPEDPVSPLRARIRVRALLDPVLVEAIVIQYLVQIKRRRGRREKQKDYIREGAGKATIKFLVRIYAHERKLLRNTTL